MARLRKISMSRSRLSLPSISPITGNQSHKKDGNLIFSLVIQSYNESFNGMIWDSIKITKRKINLC